MVTAQVLEATHTVDDRMRVVNDKVLDVDNRVLSVDNKVAGIDDRVVGVDNRVAGVDDKVKAVYDKVAVVIDGVQLSLISHKGNTFNSDVPRGKRDKGGRTTSGRRHGSIETLVVLSMHWHWCAGSSILTGKELQQDLCKWLSPSDPSINHNVACDAHRKQTADWFFQGRTFTEWKSNGSLLWLHGKRTFFRNFRVMDADSYYYSGLWEERTLVCRCQTPSTLRYSPPN